MKNMKRVVRSVAKWATTLGLAAFVVFMAATAYIGMANPFVVHAQAVFGGNGGGPINAGGTTGASGGCYSNSDCPSGQTCFIGEYGSEGTCIAGSSGSTGNTGGSNNSGGTCWNDYDCASGQVCTSDGVTKGNCVAGSSGSTGGTSGGSGGSQNTNPSGGGTSAGSITLFDPLGGQGFSSVVGNILSFVFYDIAIPLTVMMALVGGFQLMTSSGDPEKVQRGRRTLLYAAIGFGVVLIAGGLATLIQNILTGS